MLANRFKHIKYPIWQLLHKITQVSLAGTFSWISGWYCSGLLLRHRFCRLQRWCPGANPLIFVLFFQKMGVILRLKKSSILLLNPSFILFLHKKWVSVYVWKKKSFKFTIFLHMSLHKYIIIWCSQLSCWLLWQDNTRQRTSVILKSQEIYLATLSKCFAHQSKTRQHFIFHINCIDMLFWHDFNYSNCRKANWQFQEIASFPWSEILFIWQLTGVVFIFWNCPLTGYKVSNTTGVTSIKNKYTIWNIGMHTHDTHMFLKRYSIKFYDYMDVT